MHSQSPTFGLTLGLLGFPCQRQNTHRLPRGGHGQKSTLLTSTLGPVVCHSAWQCPKACLPDNNISSRPLPETSKPRKTMRVPLTLQGLQFALRSLGHLYLFTNSSISLTHRIVSLARVQNPLKALRCRELHGTGQNKINKNQ